MKKQLFTLMLSTAIFTTNPLFAMDQPEQDPFEGRGIILNLPPEIFLNVFEEFSDEDTLNARPGLVCASKDMKSVFEDLWPWSFLREKICTPFIHNIYTLVMPGQSEKTWVKKQNIKDYLRLFTIEENKNNSYNVTIGQLVSFHKESYPDSVHQNSWSFKIGNRSFQLFKYGANVAQDYLETLDQNITLPFSRAFPEVEGYNPWKSENLFLSLVGLAADNQFINWAKEMSNPRNYGYKSITWNYGKDVFSPNHNVFYIRPIAAPIAAQIEEK